VSVSMRGHWSQASALTESPKQAFVKVEKRNG
jgi:hypothetical protein